MRFSHILTYNSVSSQEDKQIKTKNKKKVINIFLITIIFSILTWLGIEEYKEKNIIKNNYEAQNVSTNINITNEEIVTNKYEEVKKEEVSLEYNGYEITAKLEIPKINLETYVLKTYSNESLNISVVKFWGAKPNTLGNFCIAGHNFKNKNMFHDLKDLNVGDNLFIIDNNIGRIEYEIYNIYKVLPDDVGCLSQETNGEKEVTLITCTNDSSKRIIVKAKEKNR